MAIIRKKEELQLPLLFAHIRLREHQGVLIFLTCATADVEHYLIQTLRDELEEEYAFETIPLHIQDYAPFTAIWHRPAGTKTLLIFNAFDFEAFYQKPDAFKTQIGNLCANLNLNRDFIPEKKLKCVFILPPEAEHRIALTAGDFYHFKSYTASFTDDAAFHRGIAEAEQGDEGRGDRIAFLLRRLKKASKAKQLAPLHFELGSLYDDISNINQALHHLEKAQELYRHLKDEKNLSAVLGNIGLVYCTLGQLEESLKYFQQALAIDKKIGYLQGQADQRGNIGAVHRDMSQPEDALKYFQEALAIDKKIGYLQGQASGLSNIGLVHRDMSQPEDALKYFQEALAIDKKIGYLQGQASDLGNIGLVYRDLSKPEGALKYHKEALVIDKKIGYLQGQANQLSNIGLVYSDWGRPEDALKCLKEALAIHKKIGYLQGQASALGNIGLVYRALGQPEDALKYLKEAREIFTLIKMPHKADQINEWMAEIVAEH